jgi:hypothetical protein
MALALFVQTGVSFVTPALTSAQVAGATPEPDTNAAPQFILEPIDETGAYFTVEAEPGSSTTLTVALGIAGSEPAEARTFAADVFSLINGGFGIEKDGEPTSGATTWLDYPADSLELQPDEVIEREFTLEIPDKTKPGQYITGLVLQTAEPIAVGDSEMLRQTIAKAIAVFITVPGPVKPKLTIGEATLTPLATTHQLQIALSNDGNVLLKPAGTVTVTTIEGETIMTAPVLMGSVYAGTSTLLELQIPTLLPPGDYEIAVSLADEETELKVKEDDLTVTVADDAAVAEVNPVTIGDVVVTPAFDPSTNDLQVVGMVVTLNNAGQPVPNAQLTLRVTRDGELVEDFPLNSSLVVPSGSTEIQQRYLPITGWEPGAYRFAVTLEAIDPTTGQATVLDTFEVAEPVEAS